ncbi:MAG: hypothetical protein U1E94_01770 [Agitococcus sp.]
MKALVLLFWQMLRFKRSPEDAPYSQALLMLILIFNFGVSASIQLVAKPDMVRIALLSPAVMIIAELIILYILFHFKQLQARFVQTQISIFACDTLLSLMTFPIVLLSLQLGNKSTLLPVLGLLEVTMMIWSLMMRGFIYHRALNISPLLANVLAFMVMMVSLSIIVQLFPEILQKATAAAEAASAR